MQSESVLSRLSIAGVVVLYKPNLEEVNSNIETYLEYIDRLYVVINETSSVIVDSLVVSEKLILIENPENYGIAKALNQGAERAVFDGFQWLLTMDQDSSFSGGAYFEAFNNCCYSDVAIFSPNHSIHRLVNRVLLAVDLTQKMVMTSGNIIDLKIWCQLGGFEEKLFIDGVDHDYCLKVIANKNRICVFNNIYLNHNLGDLEVVVFFKKNVHLFKHSPLRHYYITRNFLFLVRQHFSKFPFLILKLSYFFFKEILKIMIFYNNKVKYLNAIRRGIFDYFIGRFNRCDSSDFL